MVDPVVPPSTLPQDFVRQTQHRAVTQAADVYTRPGQAQPPVQPLDAYQPPTYQVQAAEPQFPASTQAEPYVANTQIPTQPVQDPNLAVPPSQTVEMFPGVPKSVPEEIVVEWMAPSRPFRPRKRQYYTTILLIGVLISLILFFANQLLPIAVVVAVVFLCYVLAVVPPGEIKHSLTTYGIRLEEQLYFWEELGRFWFSTKYGQNILHVEIAKFPWRLTILLGDIDPKDMGVVLSEVLINQKPPLTSLEKAAEWLQAKIPLDGD